MYVLCMHADNTFDGRVQIPVGSETLRLAGSSPYSVIWTFRDLACPLFADSVRDDIMCLFCTGFSFWGDLLCCLLFCVYPVVVGHKLQNQDDVQSRH